MLTHTSLVGQENEDRNMGKGIRMDSSIEVHGVYADALGSKILTDSMGSPVTEIAALEGGVLEGGRLLRLMQA